MPYKNNNIQNVLPENKVRWKLIFCPKRRATHNEYRILIELKYEKRQNHPDFHDMGRMLCFASR